MNIVCLGASFTGRYLSDNFSDDNAVFFISRKDDELWRTRYRMLNDANFYEIVSNNPIDVILDTIPAIVSEEGIEDPPYISQVETVIRSHPNARYVHISSTSVYPPGHKAEHGTALPVMNENTKPGPDARRGMNRLALENRILGLYPKAKIVRSGGLYGPGRCTATRFKQGDFRRTDRANRMISRIHVHDLCRLVLAIGGAGCGSVSLVNAVDERPALNSETFAFIEDTLGIEVPGNWRNAQPEGRQIVSLYAKDLLNGRFEYPTYKEGFLRCLADEDSGRK